MKEKKFTTSSMVVLAILCVILGAGFGFFVSWPPEVVERNVTQQLGYFRDANVFEAWLDRQPMYPNSTDAVLWYQHALATQQAAARDGYLISAVIDSNNKTADGNPLYTVLNYAVLQDGSLYWWDPETHDIYYWLDTRHF